jgi:DHA1 family arabinose polymer transporter-like MFS transporter
MHANDTVQLRGMAGELLGKGRARGMENDEVSLRKETRDGARAGGAARRGGRRPVARAGLVALSAGAFVLGFAEFAMMGMLPSVALDLGVSVPWAGNFISAYAIGVCLGTLVLVFGRRARPKRLLMVLVAMMLVGGIAATLSPGPRALVAARLLSGLPHGAYFGMATIVAKRLAPPGAEGRAVGVMVLGQTLANTLGVPLGTVLASCLTWRAAFGFDSLCALAALALVLVKVPDVSPIPDAGLLGQFRFLREPAPWVVLGAVLLGNTGLFCWWSYVSPWFTGVGGFSDAALPALLAWAGIGMVVGSQVGGRMVDRMSAGRSAMMGHALGATSLALIFLVSGASPALVVLLALSCSAALFFPASAQQILMVQVGRGGGEMIGSACVQVAYNAGNALGALIGQCVLNAGATYVWPSLAGVPFSLGAVALLALFTLRFEPAFEREALGR